MSRSFGKSFPQKIALPKLRPHCSATCPNTWRAEPRKKNTLSFFKRNFTTAKSEMQGVFFFRGCRGSARQWRNDTSVRGSLEPPRAPRVRIIGLSSQKRFAQRLLFHRQNSKSESEAEIISMEINFQPKNTHGVFFGWGHNPTYP